MLRMYFILSAKMIPFISRKRHGMVWNREMILILTFVIMLIICLKNYGKRQAIYLEKLVVTQLKIKKKIIGENKIYMWNNTKLSKSLPLF